MKTGTLSLDYHYTYTAKPYLRCSTSVTIVACASVNAGCSDLLSMGVAQDGWLHQKRAVHNIAEKLRIGFLATGLFSCTYVLLFCPVFCLFILLYFLTLANVHKVVCWFTVVLTYCRGKLLCDSAQWLSVCLQGYKADQAGQSDVTFRLHTVRTVS